MCWPRRPNTNKRAITTDGTNSTTMTPQENDEGRYANAGNDHVEKIPRESPQGRELVGAADDLARQAYHDLSLKFDGLKVISKAQENEIKFYREIVSVSSATSEMDRRLHDVQDQLRQFSDDLVLLTRECSRVLHESSQREEHKISMRDDLERITRTLLLVTEENKSLKEGRWLRSDKMTTSEKEESRPNSEVEEKASSTTSKIHRKKARTNLKSAEGGRHIQQLSSSHEQLVQNQEGPKDSLPAQLTALRADFTTLHSKLQSAETHIVNISGNLGALIPREVVKNVSTKQEIRVLASELKLTR